jgi:creatinine amidohydrolase
MTGYKLKTSNYDKAVLAIGSTEYHGDHLPYGTDTIVAMYLAEQVAKRINRLLLLPPLHYGMSKHYASFPIALTLSTETLIRVLREIFDSLFMHGIKKLLIINGHDGNIAALEASTREFRVEHSEMKIAVLEAWWKTAGELLPAEVFEVWGGLGHAGEGETSMMLARAPNLVDMSHARSVVPELPPYVQFKWIFKEITPYGVTGDPTRATEEKGIMMRDVLVDLLTTFVKEMDRKDWNPISPLGDY